MPRVGVLRTCPPRACRGSGDAVSHVRVMGGARDGLQVVGITLLVMPSTSHTPTSVVDMDTWVCACVRVCVCVCV
jgi:hypothetical protein